MSTTYYKAVRPDGCSFWDPEFRWVPESGPVEGIVVEHPNPSRGAAGYLSVSAVATDCTGMQWPCRLLEVEPVDGHPVHAPSSTQFPNKRTASAWRVVRELPAHQALGPQGEYVAAFIAHAVAGDVWDARRAAEVAAWDAARRAAEDAAEDAARRAAWLAARLAAEDAAWVAAWDVARALTVRDLLSTEHYDTLTRAWREIVGPIHPDDPDLRGAP